MSGKWRSDMKKEYRYRSMKEISKEGILFDDGFFLDFELSRINWAKNHNIMPDSSDCVADRDITAPDPYYEFYIDNHVVIYFNKRIFSNRHNWFQNFRLTIEQMGYTTYDLS